MASNCAEYGIELFDMQSAERGIVHVIAPELGLTQPGMTIVCGDSHTSTHGAFGALAFGIGTSEVGHVLATQCLLQRKAKTMAITVDGPLAPGVGAKDVILHIIGVIGVNGGTGHVLEYRGSTIRAMDMEQRMTLCNMSIEAGARAGMVAPDETTLRMAGEHAARADKARRSSKPRRAGRSSAATTARASTRKWSIDARDIRPTLTWGTHPGTAIAVDKPIPAANDAAAQKSLDYMHFDAGHVAGRHARWTWCSSVPAPTAASATCAKWRTVLRDRRVDPRVRMLVVPGSELVKRQAEAEGIDADRARRRRRMARTRLLDVHRHERRPGRAGATGGQHQQPQFRRPPGPGLAHAAGFADDRGVGGGEREGVGSA